jgi:hypothetical protein
MGRPLARRLLLGGVGFCVILLIGVAVWHELAPPVAQVEAERPRARATRELPDAPDPSTYSLRRLDEAVRQMGEARRLAEAGDFGGADRALQAAEQTAPGLPEIVETRHEIEELKSPEGRFAHLLAVARAAANRDDTDSAMRALAAAEQIRKDEPEIAQLRQAIAERQARTGERKARVTKLLRDMQAAVTRRDFAAAYSAINEAERLDVADPAVATARAELTKAQEEARAR